MSTAHHDFMAYDRFMLGYSYAERLLTFQGELALSSLEQELEDRAGHSSDYDMGIAAYIKDFKRRRQL